MFTIVRRVPGSMWLGWNGRVETADLTQEITRQRIGNVGLLGRPLAQRESSDDYHGFCNAALWPLFHCFQGRVRVVRRQEAWYRSVQPRFAKALRPLLRGGDLVWVHDYHFRLLRRELTMPLEERLQRHRALLARIAGNTVHDRGRRFIRDLGRGRESVPLPPERLQRRIDFAAPITD